ncbi:hypothetical protein FisN_16Lh150 [Fistulifera solaris]|uniref:Glycosyltransferase family 92 protein n=1 Tax=Fistulifera solaris TaxID=1519565 RepID=A0A1Z5KJP4_FISSO|nr:hypothetical protein FisN_16Lh150 [Fistulifera solaris]|eukprot:GAX26312.1 hypothetical protein FisN_16Lh150 [Fistulifera solaris]
MTRTTLLSWHLVPFVTICLCLTNIFIAFRVHHAGVDETSAIFVREEFAISKRQLRHMIDEHSNTATTIQTPPFTTQESFGACALVLNQNHRMTEWIAYHYFALPLRSLIIAYDPKSTQRATDLLHRWKDVIDIIEWEEDDYLPINWTEAVTSQGPSDKPIERLIHEHRQVYFMQQCTVTLAAKNVSRVIHHDVDEYLRINTDIIKRYDTTRPGHITHFLNRQNTSEIRWLPNASCWLFVRLYFIPWNNATAERVHQNRDLSWIRSVPLETLSYRYRKTRAQQTGKGIIHLSHIPPTLLTGRKNNFEKWMNVHNPLGKPLCQGPWPVALSPLLLNHYLGSYEAYKFAAQWDPRFRDDSEWERRLARGKGEPVADDGIVNWVDAFVKWQSEDVARELLSDAGWRQNEQ